MREDEKARSDRPDGTDAARTPYSPPVLRVYGDVAALTRAIGNTGTVADGGHGSMSKTS